MSGESGSDFAARMCAAAKRAGEHTKVSTRNRTYMAYWADRLADLAQSTSGALDRDKDLTKLTKSSCFRVITHGSLFCVFVLIIQAGY